MAVGVILFEFTNASHDHDSGTNDTKDGHDATISQRTEGLQEVGRVETGEKDAPASLYWRDVQGLDKKFSKLFAQKYYEQGGEDATIAWVLERTDARIGTASGERINRICRILAESEMITGEVDVDLFTTLVYGGMDIAGNKLGHQLEAFHTWVSGREHESYGFPTHKMHNVPLDYPPEMLMSHMAGETDGLYLSEDAIARAGDLRDQLVFEYAAIYQEEFNMLPTLRETAKDLGVEIPRREEHEAFAALEPKFAAVLRASKEIGVSYVANLKTIMAEEGIMVVNAPW